MKSSSDSLISEHEPRKETETSIAGSPSSPCRLFQNTNPERGRKLSVPCLFCESFLNFRTRTPKGDGNAGWTAANPEAVTVFQNTNPERGRKPRLCFIFMSFTAGLFQNTNPERGRKLGSLLVLGQLGEVFQNTNPERGRKHFIYTTLCAYTCTFQNTNPERGRKHFANDW